IASSNTHASPSPAADGFTFQNVKSHLCIGVSGGSMSEGAPVQQFCCDDRANQRWSASGPLERFRSFTNGKSGKCMGIDQKPGSKTKGASLKQFGCDSPKTAQWRYEVIQKGGSNGFPAAHFSLTNSGGFCIGVDSGSKKIGAQLMQFPCD